MAEEALAPELVAFVKAQKDRHEIRECMLRYTRGVDRHDRELMASAYHSDSVNDHPMRSMPGPEYCDWVIDYHAQNQINHHHYIANHTVDLDGDVAHAETYWLYLAANRQGPPMLSFGRYLDRLEKREGKWAIAYRRLVTEGSTTYAEPMRDGKPATPRPGGWSRDDASYARPLTPETPGGMT